MFSTFLLSMCIFWIFFFFNVHSFFQRMCTRFFFLKWCACVLYFVVVFLTVFHWLNRFSVGNQRKNMLLLWHEQFFVYLFEKKTFAFTFHKFFFFASFQRTHHILNTNAVAMKLRFENIYLFIYYFLFMFSFVCMCCRQMVHLNLAKNTLSFDQQSKTTFDIFFGSIFSHLIGTLVVPVQPNDTHIHDRIEKKLTECLHQRNFRAEWKYVRSPSSSFAQHSCQFTKLSS